MQKLVQYHGKDWGILTLEGWITLWVYRFGLAVMWKSDEGQKQE